MLPTFTTAQVNDGIDHADLLIDLSDYMKKKDGATKDEIQILTDVLANKLDAKPQHRHDMADIDLLQSTFDTKLDKEQIKNINFITAPRVEKITIRPDAISEGYSLQIDSSGDLVIMLNDSVIGSYSKMNAKWSFEPDMTRTEAVLENHTEALNAVCNATLRNITDISSNRTKITAFESALNEYVAKTDAVLKNHYDAILLLCQKHGMIDGDGDEGNNITPE